MVGAYVGGNNHRRRVGRCRRGANGAVVVKCGDRKTLVGKARRQGQTGGREGGAAANAKAGNAPQVGKKRNANVHNPYRPSHMP